MLKGLIKIGTETLKLMAKGAFTIFFGTIIVKYGLTNHTDEAIAAAFKKAEDAFIAKEEEKKGGV